MAQYRIRPFPFVLVRVSGAPFHLLEALDSKNASKVVGEVIERSIELDRQRERLSHTLYGAVARATDQGQRRCLLKLRRDVFNGRMAPTARDISTLETAPDDCLAAFLTYRALAEEITRLLGLGEAFYVDDLQCSRVCLRQHAREWPLQNGLLLSSGSLLTHGLPRYLDTSGQVLDRLANKAERALVKYLSRMCSKTSPFSSFGLVALADSHGVRKAGPSNTAPQPVLEWHSGDTSFRGVSFVRLNNMLWFHLRAVLLRNREVRDRFPLQLNSTLRVGEDTCKFLTNCHNLESFQEVTLTPVLRFTCEMASSLRTDVTRHELVRKLITTASLRASYAEVARFVDDLIDIGLLEYSSVVSGADPNWDATLTNEINHLHCDDPSIRELPGRLGRLRSLVSRYEREHRIRERRRILALISLTFQRLCAESRTEGESGKSSAPLSRIKPFERSGRTTPAVEEPQVFRHRLAAGVALKPEDMLFEDIRLDTVARLDPHWLKAIVTCFDGLLVELARFEIDTPQRLSLTAFFHMKYGGGRSVPLLTLYEDYYREVRMPMEARAAAEGDLLRGLSGEGWGTRDPAAADWLSSCLQWEAAFSSEIGPRLHGLPQEVYVAKKDLSRVGCACPPCHSIEPSGRSFAVMIQLLSEASPEGCIETRAVWNGNQTGFGKMYSRFLHLFNPSVTHALRLFNKTAVDGVLLAENADATFHSANVHPALMPFEIRSPGSQNTLPPPQQLQVSDLAVRCGSDLRSLDLVHTPSGKGVLVFDLGFEAASGRSRLFQLLSLFTSPSAVPFSPVFRAVNQPYMKGASSVACLPRIIYDDKVVLQRRTWLVPAHTLPARRAGESEWSCFVRLNRWRREYDIPDEVFVRLTDPYELRRLARTTPVGPRRDDYKPQFVSFNSPILVSLFADMLRRVPTSLSVSEMLPHPAGLPKPGANRHALELVIQWYRFEANPR